MPEKKTTPCPQKTRAGQRAVLRYLVGNAGLRVQREIGTNGLGNAHHAGFPSYHVNFCQYFQLCLEAWLAAGGAGLDQPDAGQHHQGVAPALAGGEPQAQGGFQFHRAVAGMGAAVGVPYLAVHGNADTQAKLTLPGGGQYLPGGGLAALLHVDQRKGRRGAGGQVAHLQGDAGPAEPFPAAGYNSGQQKPLGRKRPAGLIAGRLRLGTALATAASFGMALRTRRRTAGFANAVGGPAFTGAGLGAATVALAVKRMAIPPPVPAASGMRIYFHMNSLP